MTPETLDAIAIGLNDIDRPEAKAEDLFVAPEQELPTKLPGLIDHVIASPGFGARREALDEKHSLG